jgi:adenine-specific DNA methylase
MGEIWVAVIAAVATTATAILGLIGAAWKLRKDREFKRLEGDASTEIAVIQTGSTERIHIVDTLMARVTTLEEDTQVKDNIIIDLTRESAVAVAKAQLLEAEKKMFLRENTQLANLVEEQANEIIALKRQLQMEVSEALSTLDDIRSEPGYDKDE